MAMKNKYSKNAKTSEAKIRQIVRLFAVDLNAVQIAAVADVNRNTVNKILAGIRSRIAQACETESPFSGEIEVDESYFDERTLPAPATPKESAPPPRFDKPKEDSQYFI